jgi:hypothetical protein
MEDGVMIWYLSEPHKAAFDVLTEAKSLKGVESESGLSEVVTTKALAKLVTVGLVVEDSGTYDRSESVGAEDIVGSYVR